MNSKTTPMLFRQLQTMGCLKETDILHTRDGFYLAYRSVADMLARKNILDFPDSEGKRQVCSSFFDDWFVYAVPEQDDWVYSLLKLREQEHDQIPGAAADGDTPGVTICFIRFDCGILLDCLRDPSDENRRKLNAEINRVVARSGQRHHEALKRYFVNPQSEGAYLVASVYTKHIAAMAEQGCLPVPDFYREMARQYTAGKHSAKVSRLPKFLESLNQEAGYTVCDNEKIFIQDPAAPNRFECAAILASHTGNTSVYSFAAEVEYHARFLVPIARFRIPLIGKSVYASAVRADMTVGDTEFQGPAPFYRPDSRIVMNQYHCHKNNRT